MVLPFVALYLYLGIGSLILLHWQLLPTFLIDLLNLMTASLNNFVRWVVNQKAFFFEELRLSMYDVILTFALLLFLYFGYIKMKKRILLGLFSGIILLQWFAHQAKVPQERKTAVWLMPACDNTVLVYKNKKTLRIFCTQEISESNRMVKEFQNEFRIDRIQIEELKNTYVIEGKTLFFIDSLWVENFDFKKLSESKKKQYDLQIERAPKEINRNNGKNEINFFEKWKIRFFITTEWILADWARRNRLAHLDYKSLYIMILL